MMKKIDNWNQANQILVIHKEKGMTSRDVVNIVSKKLGTKKVGHTGTLDPLATGVLVLLTGRYTKLNSLFMATEKEYIATVEMGYLTDTLDIEGKVMQQDHKIVTRETLEKVFDTFPRKYFQEVPLYSAVKVKGKKLYQYAREGKEVPLPKKEVIIYELELLKVKDQQFTFRTVVSKGTYIRSLIRDLGVACNALFTMSALERTKQGKFKIEDAIFLQDVTKNFQGLPLEEVLDLPVEVVDSEQAFKIQNGCPLKNEKNYEQVLFLSKTKEPLAIYKKDENLLKVEKMIGCETKCS